MYELALFAGAGGGILGGILRGHSIVGAVEIEDYPRQVILQRQRDGILPEFPIWDDVRTFRIDNPECKEYIKGLQSVRDELCISGGFPCQDISCAGKGAGIDGKRSGLWREYARIIGEIRPRFVFVENSPMLVVRGLGRVLGDLSEMGYDARWGVVSAAEAGAVHLRERIWIVAWDSDLYRDKEVCEVQGVGQSSKSSRNSKDYDADSVQSRREECDSSKVARRERKRARCIA